MSTEPNQQNFKLSICSDTDLFAQMQSRWNDLVVADKTSSIFVSWEWMFSWWQVFQSQYKLMLILVLDESDRLVGIGPFCIRSHLGGRYRSLQFIGADSRSGTDFIDVITDSAFAESARWSIVKCILDQRSEWDMLKLNGLVQGSATLSMLWDIFAENLRLWPERHCPVGELPATHNEFLAGLGRRNRRNIRNHERRLQDEFKVTISRIDAVQDIADTYSQFVSLHRTRRNKTVGFSSFDNARIIAFQNELLPRMATNGHVRFYQLENENGTFGMAWFFVWRGHLYLYQGGFDNHHLPSHVSIMPVLISHAVADAISDGLQKLHLLDGNTLFKQGFATRTIETHMAFGWHTLHGRMFVILIQLGVLGRTLVRALIPIKLRNRIRRLIK
ncbi:GNAT family N-acetyltransferase [candidate division KSB1 bacterium]|nr:GNAT family N-acetyltransferase [candidate division KSB1 bacterium]